MFTTTTTTNIFKKNEDDDYFINDNIMTKIISKLIKINLFFPLFS